MSSMEQTVQKVTLESLRQQAKTMNLVGYSKLKKSELESLISSSKTQPISSQSPAPNPVQPVQNQQIVSNIPVAKKRVTKVYQPPVNPVQQIQSEKPKRTRKPKIVEADNCLCNETQSTVPKHEPIVNKAKSKWLEALGKYNSDKGSYTIPKKGSNEYNQVLDLMRNL